MKKKLYKILASIMILVVFFQGCEEFFEPTQELIIKEDDFFNDWYDYRSAEMGIYALQQRLAEQLLLLGELRGDLMVVTENASRDLQEINNFEISEQNRFASAIGFYNLIAACNNLQRALETYHPEVLDKEANITNYDKLYGEIIVMRSWAYFNAVRIYKKIPYVPVSLTSIDEIVEFVNSPHTVVDSMDVIFHIDGKHNDTIWYDVPIELPSAYLELDQLVDSCANDMLNNIKAVGVNHYQDNDDNTWEVTVWNEFGMEYLLGQMYLFKGDLVNAIKHFDKILYINDVEADDVRFGLTSTFQRQSWKNILTSLNMNEHIFVIWFGKSNQQTNNFQKYFSVVAPNSYEIKPTKRAVHYWETIWDGYRYRFDVSELTDYMNQELLENYLGEPGDFHRGPNVSYAYMNDGNLMDNGEIREMLSLKRDQNDFEVDKVMEGVDTVIFKYTIGKENDPFARDANFIVARAASVHLYAAEIYCYYAWIPTGDDWQLGLSRAEQFLNDGSYNGLSDQLGVRGRVGFADRVDEMIKTPNIIFIHDPYTYEIVDFMDLTGNLQAKQRYMEEEVLKERARELAFEGERFYDLMRIAQRRDDPSFLADMIAGKFEGAESERIRTHLMDENNWYLPFYLGTD